MNMSHRTSTKALSALLLLMALWVGSANSFAQTFTATLTGSINDQAGSALPNAKVVATNQGTKLEYTATTTESGVYTLPFLPIGTYVISVEANGFKKLVSNEIKLEVNQTARVNLAMQVGGVTELVNITDVAPILQTENTTVGTVISGQTTTNLPLNGRNFQQLTLLVPGTINPNPGGFNGAGQGAQGRPYVNGNREQSNVFLLDGVSVDETIDNRIGYKPNVDAIAEFKIETSNSSAEFGNVTGATVITTVKSGTNDYHGNVFEFFRNDKLDANTWANNRASTATNKVPKQKLRQNIFGGTFGGPIARNKVFFFMDYQGTKQRSGGGTTRTVAPSEWRAGNLSSLSAFIRDPLLSRTLECRATPAAPTAGVNYQAACFAGSIIPTTRFSPTAKALFADPNLYPLPTRAGTTSIGGNYTTSTAAQIDGHQFDVKIDARLSDKDNFSGRYSFGNYENPGSRGALPTDLTSLSFSRPQNISLNWTRTINSNIVNEARLGFNRAVFISDAFDWNKLGNANAKFGIAGTQAIPGLTLINLGSGLSGVGAQAVTENNVTNTFHYGDNLSISHGRHYFKMGGQWLRYQQNRFYPGNNGLLGFFTYGNTFTGVAFADFLLDQLTQKGLGNTGGQNPGKWGHRQNRVGVFFQDDYKVRSNLTLNLGMRWEYTSPVIEVKDRQANFDIATGKILYAGKDGNSRALYDPYKKGFEPRIGFAWTPEMFKNKLVVRAGYGITQYMEGTGSNLRLPLNPPFFSEADVSYTTDTIGAGTIATGFVGLNSQILPNGTVVPAGLIRIWNPKLRPQFTQQWNLTTEYQLSSATSISVGYVGHFATHLVAPTDNNQALPGTGDPATWVNFNLRRPFSTVLPKVTQVSGTDSWAISRYHSLQTSLRQRYSKGLEFMVSYTWSKGMTDNLGYYGSGGVSAQGAYSANERNRHGYNYGPAFFDATHNLVISGVYDLPFGKGRNFGDSWHPAVNAILGGWNVSNIIGTHTGFPITITAADRSLQNPRGAGRPDTIGVPTINGNIPDCYIGNSLNPFCPTGSATAFALQALGSFGSTGVGTVRAPGYFNWDFGVGKKFHLSESKYFDFRTEFFNAPNHPNFNPPDRTWSATSTTFGQITSVISSPRNLEFVLKFHF
jgi:hypothetical protein